MKPITVGELINALRTLDPKMKVAIAADSEGNSYSLMANEMFLGLNVYMQDKLGNQDAYFEKKEMNEEGDTVTDYYQNTYNKKDMVECVILWPTN